MVVAGRVFVGPEARPRSGWVLSVWKNPVGDAAALSDSGSPPPVMLRVNRHGHPLEDGRWRCQSRKFAGDTVKRVMPGKLAEAGCARPT